ncbi:hypothetical protein SSBG_00334 [Streptomyces sp. SPB074]|nr:hypothetical protein SSBG_00334 [Streptomyces sp. SPB074]
MADGSQELDGSSTHRAWETYRMADSRRLSGRTGEGEIGNASSDMGAA